MKANKMLICRAFFSPLLNQLCLFPLVLLKKLAEALFWEALCSFFHHCWVLAGFATAGNNVLRTLPTIWDYSVVISGGVCHGELKCWSNMSRDLKHIHQQHSRFIVWLFLFTLQICSQPMVHFSEGFIQKHLICCYFPSLYFSISLPSLSSWHRNPYSSSTLPASLHHVYCGPVTDCSLPQPPPPNQWH